MRIKVLRPELPGMRGATCYVAWVLSLGCLLFYGCERSTSAKVEKTAEKAAPISVTVTPVRVQTVQRTIEIVGTLHANEQVTVSSELDGRIASVGVDLGDALKAGDILARIQDTEFRFAVEQLEASLNETLARLGLVKMPPDRFDVSQASLVQKAQAELNDGQVNLKRVKALYEEKVISAQEYDTAETRVKTAQATYKNTVEEAKALVALAHSKEAQLGAARKRLRDTVIRAPLPGAISKRMVSSGEYVKVGTPLFVIVQDNPVKLRGMIPERFAPRITAGQAVEARVDSFPERRFKGKLTRISPASEIESRSFLVEALIENPERLLKPGFFARGIIGTHVDANALTVPQQALVTFAGVTKVFVVDNHQIARERVVETGVRVGANEVEITQGLKPGELVATSGLTRLTDGSPVQASGPSLPLKDRDERKEAK